MKEKINWWITEHKILSGILCTVFLCAVYTKVCIFLDAAWWVIVLVNVLLLAVVWAYVEASPMFLIQKSIDELNDNCNPYPLKENLERLLAKKWNSSMHQSLMIDYALVHRSIGEYERNYEMLHAINIDKTAIDPIIKVVYYNNLMDAAFYTERYEEASIWYTKMAQVYADAKKSEEKQELEAIVEAGAALYAFCQKDYAKTIEVLDEIVHKDIRMKVDLSLLYARTCILTGNTETAKEKLQYVIEKGNQLYSVKIAEQLLAELE